jgi:hypothetical protein
VKPNIARVARGTRKLRNRIAISNVGGLPDIWREEPPFEFPDDAVGAPEGFGGCAPRPPSDEAPGLLGGMRLFN